MNNGQAITQSKTSAYDFLTNFEKALNSRLPPAREMEPWIRKINAESKSAEAKRHLRIPEAAFLNGHVIPILFDAIQVSHALSKEQARAALLNEYHRSLPEYSEKSPIRWAHHPFRKVLAGSPTEIYRGWTNPDQGGALTQSSPDFSLREPFPHTILFEGKYFSNGSLEYAQRELVKDIYQAFFYRGLPALQAAKGHPDWSYEYACLLAYDASPKGTLAKAWKDLDVKTRKAFWEGANIFVIIAGGQGREQK